MITEIDTAAYDSMDKSGVMLVEFYSKTCGPCKMLSFVLKDIDKNDPDTFAKVEAALPVDKRTAFNEAWTKLRCKLESEGADTVTAIRRSAELLDGKSGDEVISYAAQL